MTRDRVHRWIEALKRMQARPGVPVPCPDRGTGTLVADDIRVPGVADPDGGVRIVRRAHRGRHLDVRVRFARLASPPGA